MLQLSVIIVNYNVKYYVHQALLSVEKAATGLEHEIFVVDNNSTDGSVPFLQPLHPHVRFILNKENTGFARANNQAIRKARGQYILLLNPDTIVTEHTLTDCISLMQQRPDAGAVGVRMLNSDGTFAPESRRGIPTPVTAFCKMTGLCRLFPRSRTFGRYYMQYLDPSYVNEIEVVSGAFMFLRRSTLKQSGPLDEDYFMYGEDIDLSYRILQTGLKNLYLPTHILHYKGESTHESTWHYVRIFHQAMLIFFRKHFGHYSLFVSLPVRLAILVKGMLVYLKLQLSRTTPPVADIQRYMQQSAYYYATPSDPEGRASLLRTLAAHGITQPRLADSPSEADFVVYNAERTPYAEMLARMDEAASRRQSASLPTLATFYPSSSLFITPRTVLS